MKSSFENLSLKGQLPIKKPKKILKIFETAFKKKSM